MNERVRRVITAWADRPCGRRLAVVVGIAAVAITMQRGFVASATAPAVTSPPPARRLVSLVPAATQVLYAIGAGTRLVGVSSFDTWPPEVASLPRVGALLDPDLETILGLRPDLVIVDPAQSALVRQLQAAGIDTYTYATEDIASVLLYIESLADRLGLAAAGRTATAALRRDLDSVRRMAAAHEPIDTVLVFGRRPGSFADLWVNGGVGFLHELVQIAGGRNLYADVAAQSVRADLETLLTRVPQVLVELRLGEDDSRVQSSAIAAEWNALPGFEHTRVVVLTDSWLVIPGPRLGEAARILAAAIAP